MGEGRGGGGRSRGVVWRAAPQGWWVSMVQWIAAGEEAFPSPLARGEGRRGGGWAAPEGRQTAPEGRSRAGSCPPAAARSCGLRAALPRRRAVATARICVPRWIAVLFDLPYPAGETCWPLLRRRLFAAPSAAARGLPTTRQPRFREAEPRDVANTGRAGYATGGTHVATPLKGGA